MLLAFREFLASHVSLSAVRCDGSCQFVWPQHQMLDSLQKYHIIIIMLSGRNMPTYCVFFLVFHRFSVDFRPFQAEKHSLILLCAVSTTRRGPRASRDIELVAVIRQLDHQHLVAVRDEAAYAEACLALLELGPKDARNCLRIAKKHQKHIKKQLKIRRTCYNPRHFRPPTCMCWCISQVPFFRGHSHDECQEARHGIRECLGQNCQSDQDLHRA